MPDGPAAARGTGRRAIAGPPARPPSDRHLRVLISDAWGRPLPAGGLSAWLQRVAPRSARGTVNVALISDARMRELNRRYRRTDAATDVLSFPASPAASHPPPATSPCLGDIVIATGVAGRQARESGHRESTELRILALHGLLHLLGYDHERDEGRMRRVERRLRRQGGLREGLIERG